MADFVDLSSDYADKVVAEARNGLHTRIHSRGHCLYCGEEVVGVFCHPDDNDCRELWERDQKIKQIRGH